MQSSTMPSAAYPPSEAANETGLPLIDEHVMSEWCTDMDRADVLAILARVPNEVDKALAQIDKAIAACDHDLARRAAHRLKGMATNLGAARLAQLSRAIELETQDMETVSWRVRGLRQVASDTLAALRSYC